MTAVQGAWPSFVPDFDQATGRDLEKDPKRAIEHLLGVEALLLDAGQFQTWLNLYSDDALYWVPMKWGAAEPDGQLNIIYDDRRLLSDRIYRIETGDAHSQDPPSRTMRVVSNVLVRPSSQEESDWVAHSNFVVQEVRGLQTAQYSGKYTHIVRSVSAEDSLLISRKRVDILTCDHALPNLTFIL